MEETERHKAVRSGLVVSPLHKRNAFAQLISRFVEQRQLEGAQHDREVVAIAVRLWHLASVAGGVSCASMVIRFIHLTAPLVFVLIALNGDLTNDRNEFVGVVLAAIWALVRFNLVASTRV